MTLSRAGSGVSAAQGSLRPSAGDTAHRPDAAGDASTTGPTALFADPQSRSLARLLERIAPTDVPVLITGETGTGKELLARHIHERSGRPGKFLVVQCGQLHFPSGIPTPTAWDQGTVFFDDVDDLSPSYQCELLRLLRETESATKMQRGVALSRARIIASSSTDLGEAATAGRFRRDLLYRLNIASVNVLPLRRRPGDIMPLAHHFMHVHSQSSFLPARVLGQAATYALRHYRWPGNVRELANVILFALLTAPRREIGVEDLRIEAEPTAGQSTVGELPPETPESTQDRLAGSFALLLRNPGTHLFDDVEGVLVAEAFRTAGGNQVHTATLLGISRNVVRTLLMKHGLLEPRRRRRD